MEEVKIDKRTKGYKHLAEGAKESQAIETLKEAGIPIKMAMFKIAVKFLNEAPETAYYDPKDGAKPNKSATMYYTPHGLLCEKKQQKMIVPLGNIAYALAL